jgi:hypothetical protein
MFTPIQWRVIVTAAQQQVNLQTPIMLHGAPADRRRAAKTVRSPIIGIAMGRGIFNAANVADLTFYT